MVFVGAAAGGGPPVDCCCYLNLFTDHTTAQAWATNHPRIRGQILDQADAEDLATRLFEPLFTK